MKEEKIFFENSKGQKLVGLLNIPAVDNPPVVIMIHGFRANKTYYPWFDNIQIALLKQNIAVLRFDFHAHGESEGDSMEYTLKACAEDLAAALKFIKTQNIDKTNIGIFGTSAATIAIGYNGIKGIKTVALYDPVVLASHWQNWFNRKYADEFKEKGYMTHKPKLDQRTYKFGKKLYDEVQKGDFEKSIKNITCPTLIIYGAENLSDEEIERTNTLFKNSEIIYYLRMSHYALTSEQATKVTKNTLDWFKRYLK
jgi:uncharacterized protein